MKGQNQMITIENEYEWGCDVTINGIEFHVHSEASAAQKEAHIDDDPPPPWPWWASSNDFAGGPYLDRETAINAIKAHTDQT